MITIDVEDDDRPPKIEDSAKVCSTPTVHGEVELDDTVYLRLCLRVASKARRRENDTTRTPSNR